jgi:hypothetical protein
MSDFNLGPCCICERKDSTVRVLWMLPFRSPYGHGWGCVQCGLAAEGASAVICDECADANPTEKDLKFFCRPSSTSDYTRGRAPISELDGQPEWKHDMARHPEES